MLKKDLDALVLDSYLEVAAEDLGYKSVSELKKKAKYKALIKAKDKSKGFDISMTEENHCNENAMAERVNGILKDEFYLD